MQVICDHLCGFRVDSGYFGRKRRFSPGVCPRCGAPIRVVDDYTDKVVKGAYMVTNPRSGERLGAVMASGGEVEPDEN